jgi:acyl-CoA synthetase (AMP-forming)/AMP-acid ligase II
MPTTQLPRDLVRHCAKSYPRKLAYVDGASGRTRTWEEMHQRSDRLAAALAALGIGKGDTVCILAHDIVEVVEHFFACLKLGAWRVGINWRFSPAQMLHVIRDSGARVILVQENCLPLLGDAELDALRSEGREFIGIGSTHALELDYEDLIAHSPAAPAAWPMLDADDVCAISYTTGTTGMPKGVLWTQGGVREALVRTPLTLGLRHEDVWYNPFPMPGVPILVGTINLGNGMTTVLPGGDFDAHASLELADRYHISAGVFVPTQLKRVTEEARRTGIGRDSWRLMTFGSMPATPALIRDAYHTFGCEFGHVYGLTEATWGIVSYLGPADIRRAVDHEPALLTSCGPPALHVEVDIRDPFGAPLPAGETGEIWVRGETVMRGYWKMPERTAEVLGVDGWLNTGDIGRLDEQGYLYVVDRKSFMIISGGYNVYPAAVEEVVAEHPAVREVAVVGAPHPDWGEAVVAIVSLNAGVRADAEEILAFCRAQRHKLSRFEMPKHVLVVDDLPRGVTGKLDKLSLRTLLRSLHDRLPWNTGTVTDTAAR